MDIIHLVLGKANPERMNGVNKVVNNLATVQSQLGEKVLLWGITPDPTHNYPERPYVTRLFKTWKNKLRVSMEMREAIEAIKQPTVFHIHGGFIPEFYAISKVLASRNIPFVYLTHGAYNQVAIRRSYFKKTIYFHLFERAILKRAKSIQLVGKSEFDALRDALAADKKILIPNGHELSNFQYDFDKNHDGLQFGYLGRITLKEKGLDLLLNGFARYKLQGGKGKLVLIGDGPDRNKCQQLCHDLKIEQSVTFAGGKFGREKDGLLQHLDAFFLTSRNEGLPGVVLEAAGFSVPAVVSTATNMGQYVEAFHSGIHLRENSAVAIAEAMQAVEKAHQDGTLKKWGANARKMVQEAFNWKNIARQINQVYHA